MPSPASTPLPSRASDIQLLEKDHGGKLMLVHHLPEEYAMLKQWVSEMKYGSPNILAVLRESGATLKFYTTETIFNITVRLPGKDSGYLGGTADARIPRVGETWLRGSDIADGDYCRATWDRIMQDIVGYSLKPLQVSSLSVASA